MSAAVPTQPHNLPLHVTAETCSGATFIVVGANVGLGYEAAKHLVNLKSKKVILAVRNVSAGEAAKATIEAKTGNKGIAEVWKLDLASYDSVKAFAKKATTELDRIDGLIENAAVAISERVMAEGHLASVTVNVLSTILLAVLLLPKLSESAKKFGILPHLAIVTSRVGFDYREDWNKIEDDPLVKIDSEEIAVLKTYPLTKLLAFIAVHHLTTLIPVSRTGVVMNLVCPGLCKTELSRNAPPEFKANLDLQKEKYGRTAEDGSRTLLHGVVAGKESHGSLLSSCKIADDLLPNWVTDAEGIRTQKLVWDVIARDLEATEPGCVKRILQE